jgi:hypothetical protein
MEIRSRPDGIRPKIPRANDRPQSRNQFLHVKRFAQVIVGTSSSKRTFVEGSARGLMIMIGI